MQTGKDHLSALSDSLADIVERAARFVVAVNGHQRLPSSGVVWKPGVVVAAEHTIGSDDDLSIVLPDNRTVPARLAGRDPGTDIAVLTAETAATPAAEFASPASIKVGNMVLAVGRRGENGPCASLGVISALGSEWRTWRGGQIGRFVRADLNLYPGSSGSALINTDGLVIGMNTAGLTRNWSVTVPRESVDATIEALLAHGHVARGFLGVGLHPVRLPEGRAGLIVLSVEAAGPAAQAGLLIGDVLLSLDGRAVIDTDEVQLALGPETVGKSLRAEVYRGGTVQEIAIVAGSRAAGRR